MFDDRSFASTSYDSRSWFGLGAVVQAVNDWIIKLRRMGRR